MPRAGIDWDTLHSLDERIGALLEDTDLTQFRLVIHPDDEAEARKALKRMDKKVPIYTNGQMTKGNPMLEGIPSTRTTNAQVDRGFYEASEAAEKLWKAYRAELNSFPDYKGAFLGKKSWDDLSKVEKHVMVEGIRRLMTERVLLLGLNVK